MPLASQVLGQHQALQRTREPLEHRVLQMFEEVLAEVLETQDGGTHQVLHELDGLGEDGLQHRRAAADDAFDVGHRITELAQRPGEELLGRPQQQLAQLGQRTGHGLLHLFDLVVDGLDGRLLLVGQLLLQIGFLLADVAVHLIELAAHFARRLGGDVFQARTQAVHIGLDVLSRLRQLGFAVLDDTLVLGRDVGHQLVNRAHKARAVAVEDGFHAGQIIHAAQPVLGLARPAKPA